MVLRWTLHDHECSLTKGVVFNLVFLYAASTSSWRNGWGFAGQSFAGFYHGVGALNYMLDVFILGPWLARLPLMAKQALLLEDALMAKQANEIVFKNMGLAASAASTAARYTWAIVLVTRLQKRATAMSNAGSAFDYNIEFGLGFVEMVCMYGMAFIGLNVAFCVYAATQPGSVPFGRPFARQPL